MVGSGGCTVPHSSAGIVLRMLRLRNVTGSCLRYHTLDNVVPARTTVRAALLVKDPQMNTPRSCLRSD
ncbi:hypothetical protein Tco_0038154 [Tanacetum coccineum]